KRLDYSLWDSALLILVAGKSDTIRAPAEDGRSCYSLRRFLIAKRMKTQANSGSVKVTSRSAGQSAVPIKSNFCPRTAANIQLACRPRAKERVRDSVPTRLVHALI